MPNKKPTQEEVLFRMPEEGQDNTEIIYWQQLYPELTETPDVVEAQEPTPYLKIGNLVLSRLVETEGGEELARRNQLLRRGLQWVPAYKSEMTLAAQTLPVFISEIASKKDNTLSLVKDALGRVDSYRSEAVTKLELLKEVAVEDEGGLHPSAGGIKSQPEVVNVLANFLRQREMFDSGEWHPRNRNRQLGKKNVKNEQRLLALVGEIEREENDESIERLWRMAYTSERNRLMYWVGQFEEVKDKSIVQAALSGR